MRGSLCHLPRVIAYVSTKRHDYTIREYLASRGRALGRTIRPVAYEDVLRARRVRPGTWVFTDLERLSPSASEAAGRLWRSLEESGAPVRLVNHPLRVLRRYELLRRLRERGSNAFGVQRVTEAREPESYPVFVRGENDHLGSRTPLLHSRRELDEALEKLVASGGSRERLLVVEFCDTTDERGLFRKYSAFYIAGRVIPRHVFFGEDWSLKHPRVVDDETDRVERLYCETNPHEAEVRDVFGLAQIGFGRIDYGVRDGRIQVWEINTNPYITTDADAGGRDVRAWVGPLFAERLAEAWRQIDTPVERASRVALSASRRSDPLRSLLLRGARWLRP
jgi:hypothetical protein